jgi:hypothetical protein
MNLTVRQLLKEAFNASDEQIEEIIAHLKEDHAIRRFGIHGSGESNADHNNADSTAVHGGGGEVSD